MAWHKQDLLRNIERIAVGMAITRLDGTVEYANRYLREMLGVRSGDPIEVLFAHLETRTEYGGRDDLRRRLGASETGCEEVRIRSSSGKVVDTLYAVYPLHDDDGVVMHYVHLLQSLRDDQHLERLSRLAFYDSLTGLTNRNLFNDRLDHALAVGRRNRSAFALLYIDIDHFKRVNDTFGHETGDELLREVAARLTRSVRASDTVTRWGGDEFVAILDGVADQQLATRIASQLVIACGAPYLVRGHEYRITLSVGASFYPRDGHDAATLLERADRAMYEVKARGRNGCRIEETPRDYRFTAA